MDFAGLSDSRVVAAFWIGAAATLLAALLLLQVLSLRLALMWREQRRNRFQALIRPQLIRVAAGEDLKLPAISRRNLPVFLCLWIHLQEILRGDAKQALNRVLLADGLDIRIRRLLLTGRLDERLLAVTALGHLGDSPAWADLFRILINSSPQLAVCALRALILIDPAKASEHCIPMMARRQEWTPVRLAAIVIQADAKFQQALQAYAECLPHLSPHLPQLLRLLCVLPNNRPLAIAGKAFEFGGDPELSALRLRLVCHPAELVGVRKAYGNQHWTVQVQMAVLFCRIGAPQDARYLMSLLNSPHWWVRYRAAQALRELPGINRQALRRLIGNSADTFARDMLLHRLAGSSSNA